MIIGVPKEIKVREYRVGVVPAGVRQLVDDGHEVLVEAGAGEGSGIGDAAYVEAGARIVPTAEEVWQRSEMIIKVKEPIEPEYDRMQHGQLVFTYFHLAAVPALAKALLEKEVAAVAYETIQLDDGGLPLLKPMSEVAGKMSIQVGAMCLEKEHGGRGVLLGGVPGVRRGRVAIIGGGVVGTNAAKVAVGMGAAVTMLDVSLDRLAYLDDVFMGRVQTLYSDPHNIEKAVLGERPGGRRGAGPRGQGAAPGHPQPTSRPCPRARWWSTSPWTRAGASRPATRPPTTIPPTSSTAWSTTAWPTCPGRWPTPRPWR